MYTESLAHSDNEDLGDRNPRDPAPFAIAVAFLLSLLLVLATRCPVMRQAPLESDEFGFREAIRDHQFPMHHTLFLTGGKLLGEVVGDPYRGFVALDMVMSALALTSAWWWL